MDLSAKLPKCISLLHDQYLEWWFISRGYSEHLFCICNFKGYWTLSLNANMDYFIYHTNITLNKCVGIVYLTMPAEPFKRIFVDICFKIVSSWRLSSFQKTFRFKIEVTQYMLPVLRQKYVNP